MNRRTFFASILGASVAGTLGSLAVPAWARADESLNIYVRLIDLQKAMLANHETWKSGPAFAHVPELDDPLDTRPDVEKRRRHLVEQRIADRHAARKNYDLTPADAVLAHLNAHFAPDASDVSEALVRQARAEANAVGGVKMSRTDFRREVAIEQARREVRAVFNREIEIDTMSEASMRRVLKSTVAVAVVKGMLSVHKMPLDPKKMGAFNEFATKFRHIIL
jgi:hypothetical protein